MPFIPLHFALATLLLSWTPQASPTNAGLRGLSAASSRIVWASGTKGTVLRTLDGGIHWELKNIAGAEALDFRDIVAFDANLAIAMSSGTGAASRVYFTRDGGVQWDIVLQNPDKMGFFDAMKFWDRKHGILLGDPVDGRFTIFTTDDGGVHWNKPAQPAALPDEGAFAASGTCLAVNGRSEAWFGTGGAGIARIFHTDDGAKNWTVSMSPLVGSASSAGVFSLTFLNPKQGVTVGGDYQQPKSTARTTAITQDGGQTWKLISDASNGFRSAITYLRKLKLLITVGTSGSDYSTDVGLTWKPFANENLNAVAGFDNDAWAVGPAGRIVKLSLRP